MALPNPGMDAVPFTPLTAEFLDDMIENIESLSDGTGFENGAITTNTLAESAVTPNKLLNEYQVSVRIGTIQALSGGVLTKLNYDTENFDLNNNWNTANKNYTVPVTGYYMFSVCQRVDKGGTLGSSFIALFKNNVQLCRLAQVAQGAGQIDIISGSRVVFLTAGDVIDYRGYADGSLTNFYNADDTSNACISLIYEP